MRNRYRHLLSILGYLGALYWIFGFVLLTSLIVLVASNNAGLEEVDAWSFLVPAAVAWVLGFVLKRRWGFAPLDGRGSMLVCALGWITVSALGAMPLWMGLPNLSYLDAYFEAVSGFTTTGITMLQGLDAMPRSLLFWRALMQWLGGLGILTFFLAVTATGTTGQGLFSAESHKIFAKRPLPSLTHTLWVLWGIYAAFTGLTLLMLLVEGVGFFDAMAHAFTAISTGGFSTHDASIGYFRANYANYALIEYTLIVAMVLGGINFFIHYRALTGGLSALWDNLEMKLFWGLLGGSAIFITMDHCMRSHWGDITEPFRTSLFQVVAIMTTTGYATKDIGATPEARLYFPALSRIIFLVLMIVGGCVGSTSGGLKVMRVGVLLKMFGRQLRRVIQGRRAVVPVLVDGEALDVEEARRVSALFFAWMALLVFGAGVTALLSNLEPMAAASGMFSALGNIGPCYITVETMKSLHPLIKLTYIMGMLAGRLEILPILLLFTRRAWR